MTVFDWAFQFYLYKFQKGERYNAEFTFLNKQNGEQIPISHSFRAISPEQSQRIGKKLEIYSMSKLSSEGAWKDFGLQHEDNGFMLNNIQRISGTRNLRKNFRKGLMPGGVPMFAFTRYSYSLVTEVIRKSTSPKHPAQNDEEKSPEERNLVRIRLLCIFGVSTAVFSGCAISLCLSISASSLLSFQNYSFVSFLVISALFCRSSFIQYKELHHG